MDSFDLRKWSEFESAGGDLSSPLIIEQIAIDSRAIEKNSSLFIALRGVNKDGHIFVENAIENGAKYAIVSKDYPRNHKNITIFKVEDPLTALHQIATAYRAELSTKIIAISGSYGKTMTKDLLLKCLKQKYTCTASPESYNSQVGVPLSIFKIEQKHEFAIIEIGLTKLNEIDKLINLCRPDYTLVTPLGKKDNTNFGTLKNIEDEIIKFVAATKDDCWSLIPNLEDFKDSWPNAKFKLYFWTDEQKNLPHAFSEGKSAHPSPDYQINFPDGKIFHGKSFRGTSYYLNLINMTIKAAYLLGVEGEKICAVLDSFILEPTHCEIWRSPQGTIFVNEPYCPDPQSVEKSLSHFNYATSKQRKIYIFGGIRMDPELAGPAYQHIGKLLASAKIDQLILFGTQDYSGLIKEVETQSKPTVITLVNSQTEAFTYISDKIDTRDYVIIKSDKKIPLEELTEIFNETLSVNRCFINLSAIQNNLQTIKKAISPTTRLMIMIKAFAYGTDDERLAKYLSSIGIDIVGVSYVDEGIALKRRGVTQQVFVLNAASFEIHKLIKWDLEVAVSDAKFITELASEAKKNEKKVAVHIHVDTGMGRFGCRPKDALALAKLIKSHSSLKLEGIMTHFTSADDPSEDHFTHKQAAIFDKAIDEIEQAGISLPWIHAANSSAMIRFKFPRYNMVRVGLATFGLFQSEKMKKLIDLQLAISLTSIVVGINNCKKGDSVGYNRSYIVEKPEQKIAVLPVGYFDGLHRHYSGKSHVLIRGKKAPMVGNICMDYMMVDVTDIAEVDIGDKALIFGLDECGNYLSPEDLAVKGDSIVHELITCLGPRIQRIFIDEENFEPK